jgi:hypothetical protein
VHVENFADWKSRFSHDPWKQLLKIEQRITANTLDRLETGSKSTKKT